MIDDPRIERHFNAIESIIAPYHGHREVDALPGALLFVIQLSEVAAKTNISQWENLMLKLDSVTAVIGEIGDIVSPSEFERLKVHYAEIQHLTLASVNSRSSDKETS